MMHSAGESPRPGCTALRHETRTLAARAAWQPFGVLGRKRSERSHSNVLSTCGLFKKPGLMNALAITEMPSPTNRSAIL